MTGMPSTKVHDFITLTTASGGFVTYVKSCPANWPQALLLALSYLFSGLMLSADLDVRSRPYRRWGPLKFIWWPYMKLIPHRSWLSHGLVVGPMLRVAYLCAVLGLPVVALLILGGGPGAKGMLEEAAKFVRAHLRVAALVLTGIVLGGAMHTLADLLGSLLRRLLGIRGRDH